MNIKQIREKVQASLAGGRIEEALFFLVANVDGRRYRQEYDNALILISKWKNIKQEKLNDLISRQEYEISVSKIMVGIQSILNDLEENPKNFNEYSKKTSFFVVSLVILLIGLSSWWIYAKLRICPNPDQQNISSQDTATQELLKNELNNSQSNTEHPRPKTRKIDMLRKSDSILPTLQAQESTNSSTIEAKGQCIIDYNRFQDTALAILNAERCAFIVAQRNLLEKIKGANLNSDSDILEFNIVGEKITSRVSGQIIGVEQLGGPKITGKTMEIRVKINKN